MATVAAGPNLAGSYLQMAEHSYLTDLGGYDPRIETLEGCIKGVLNASKLSGKDKSKHGGNSGGLSDKCFK